MKKIELYAGTSHWNFVVNYFSDRIIIWKSKRRENQQERLKLKRFKNENIIGKIMEKKILRELLGMNKKELEEELRKINFKEEDYQVSKIPQFLGYDRPNTMFGPF